MKFMNFQELVFHLEIDNSKDREVSSFIFWASESYILLDSMCSISPHLSVALERHPFRFECVSFDCELLLTECRAMYCALSCG